MLTLAICLIGSWTSTTLRIISTERGHGVLEVSGPNVRLVIDQQATTTTTTVGIDTLPKTSNFLCALIAIPDCFPCSKDYPMTTTPGGMTLWYRLECSENCGRVLVELYPNTGDQDLSVKTIKGARNNVSCPC